MKKLIHFFRFFALVFTVATTATSCGVKSSPEDYNLTSLGDIQLNATNHSHGFGRSQCFSCHNLVNIHRVDRVGGDIELAQDMVRTDGITSCSVCHGNNGVTTP